MATTAGLEFDLQLTATPIRTAPPFWQPVIHSARGWILFGGASGIYIVTLDGYLQAAIAPVAGFQGWSLFQSNLYVQDGPVLQLYDLDGDEEFEAPLAAVNVVSPAKVYRRADGPWKAAQSWLYAHPAPGPLGAPLIRPTESFRSVYVLASNGAIAQFDKALGNGAVSQKPVPDALPWRLETIGGKTYVCYSSHNAIEALDADTLHETPVVVPDPRANGVGWVNARNFKDARQPAVFMPYRQSFVVPWAWIVRVDGLYVLAGQSPVDFPDPIIMAADPGAGGWPVLGQAGVTTQAAGPVRSATLRLGDRQIVGVPLLQAEGDSYAAYVTTQEADQSLHGQKWVLPPLADDPQFAQIWTDASQGTNVDADFGYMERTLASHLPPPAFVTFSLARQMFDAGIARGGPL